MKNTVNGSGEDRKETIYPYYDLESSIKFASTIRDLGGSKSVIKKSLLAKQVGLAESTPSFFQRLSAAKVFGIIEGWGAYGLTENGRNYFYPQSEQAKKEALLALFLEPRAFSFIVKRFDGDQLPITEIMGNILHQELGITESWKDRVAQIFIRSANFVGIIDSTGCLRYDAAVHTNTGGDSAIATQPVEPLGESIKASLGVTASAMTRYPRKVDPAPVGYSQWLFPIEGTYIRLETPEKMTKTVWEKLNAYVQILKPTESDQQ